MASNVFTKKDILQNLASKGYFIDIYTLEAFFAKKKIEAIFEDSQGNEFFDQNALNVVLEGLFASNNQARSIVENTKEEPTINTDLKIDDKETLDILNDISLSDGTPLINKLDNIDNIQNDNLEQKNLKDYNENLSQDDLIKQNQAMINDIEQNIITQPNIPTSTPQFDFNPVQNDFISTVQDPTQIKMPDNPSPEEIHIPKDDFDNPNNDPFAKDETLTSDMPTDFVDTSGFDDISLLSESLEAQEKLRQYVMGELSKNPADMVQKPQNSNEFKLDISERTLTMIARTMAKKIAKYVGSILAQDAKSSSQVEEYKEENRRLTQKARELEEQNRKLRLLLAESNKNLNSYKPSIFGLYKKVDPKQNKK